MATYDNHGKPQLKQQHPSLETLPWEILNLILLKLPRRELAIISTLSRRLYKTATPLVRRYAVVRVSSHPKLGMVVVGRTTNIKHLLNYLSFTGLQYTRDLTFHTEYHLGDYICASDYADELNQLGEQEENELKRWYKDGSDLVKLLELIPDNSLRSFKWFLGSCLPKQIASKGGYLPERQKAITSLSLFTCASTCSYYDEYDESDGVDFTQFRSLETLEWTGLAGKCNLRALQSCLRASATTLKDLHLGFLSDRISLDAGTQPAFMLSRVFGLEREEHRLLFPSLETLSLRFAPIGSNPAQIASVFPWEKLRTLRLHGGVDTCELLQTVADTGRLLKRLRRLEYLYDSPYPQHDSISSLDALVSFMDACEVLEDVFLVIQNPTTAYLEALPRYSRTMKRLVYHQRRRIDSPSFGLPRVCDLPNIKGTGLLRVLETAKLDYLGVCIEPVDLIAYLIDVFPRPTIRVLHIRAHHTSLTWSHAVYQEVTRELGALAMWAFGSDGLPELQLLIWGDTSNDFRAPYNRYLVRVPGVEAPNSTFREISVDEVRRLRVVEEHKHALEACPIESVGARGCVPF
ncbi:hypothetical protein VTO42DRAFT_6532 [Malbranchea cinnamomea]